MALNVAKQVGVSLAHIENSRIWAANEQSMGIMGITKALVRIEHATKICKFWVTPSMGDRVLISRKELMSFHMIPKSFPSIMKTSSRETQMCQSCAGILQLSHFEKLGKNTLHH